MIALAAATLALAAAATRPVQAVDATGTHYWTPADLPAQQGDTIEWRFAQPGNALAGAHDVWLLAPGAATAVQVGASAAAPAAQATVVAPGVYRFYCSIHGGLQPGGMNGTITVGADDPGPPSDPGEPWTVPAPPPAAAGVPPAPNPTSPPSTFESGDTVAPRLGPPRVSVRAGSFRVRVRISEAGSLTVRVLRGARMVKTRRFTVRAGRGRFEIAGLRPGRYRVELWMSDGAGLRSAARRVSIRI